MKVGSRLVPGDRQAKDAPEEIVGKTSSAVVGHGQFDAGGRNLPPHKRNHSEIISRKKPALVLPDIGMDTDRQPAHSPPSSVVVRLLVLHCPDRRSEVCSTRD